MKEIVQDGTPVLRETADAVPESLFNSEELSRLIIDMTEALDKEPDGVALAAPQIAVSYRVFIVRKDRTLSPPPSDAPPHTPEVGVYINPEIIKTSRKYQQADEGCLSVRGIYGTTSRHEKVTVRARREDGSTFERGGSGLLAQIFEHEIDHLNGFLFTDHAESLVHLNKTGASKIPFAFFGTPYVARETLERMIENDFTPAVIITNPDAPKGRGLTVSPSPVKELAREYGIPVLTPKILDKTTQQALAEFNCDYGVVVAYGKIFPTELIELFPKGVLNVHYSLLPKYRGATPTEAALLAGDTVTGVTIQKMKRALDAGDLLAQEEVLIDPSETVRELRPRLIEVGVHLLIQTLPTFEQDEITSVEQDETQATHTSKFKKEDGLLDLSASDEKNWNTYRAYADTIGTYFFTKNGLRIKIIDAQFSGGIFRILRVIPEGKREMSYEEFNSKKH